MPDAKKTLTAHVPDALADRVASAAAREERSNDWVVNQALELYLSIDEERHAHTLKALKDVDAGRVIDHASVKAWTEGLNAPAAQGWARFTSSTLNIESI